MEKVKECLNIIYIKAQTYFPRTKQIDALNSKSKLQIDALKSSSQIQRRLHQASDKSDDVTSINGPTRPVIHHFLGLSEAHFRGPFLANNIICYPGVIYFSMRIERLLFIKSHFMLFCRSSSLNGWVDMGLEHCGLCLIAYE